jgi:hypothetical protein
MPRIRYLKPEFFLDEDLGCLTVVERLCFGGLWCHADKEGRLEDRPRYLKTQLFPYDDDVDMELLLQKLAMGKRSNPSDPFIVRYTVSNRKYIQIMKFLKHQKPHHTEQASTIPPPPLDPPPPENNGATTVEQPLLNALKGKLKGSKSIVTAPPKRTRRAIDYSDEFKMFWRVYPRPIGKEVAYENWRRVLSEGFPPEDVISAAQEYARQVQAEHRENGYIKHPERFLKKGFWKDYCFAPDRRGGEQCELPGVMS